MLIRSIRIVLASIVVLASALPVAAHRAPIMLALWGSFDPSPARCQRIIGFATARCANAVWRIRRTCLDSQLAGGSCDTAATDATVAQAHTDALNLLDDQCELNDILDLSFLNNQELDTDIDAACGGADVALTSGVYGPAVRRAATSGLSGFAARSDQRERSVEKTPAAGPIACVQSTARATAKLLRFAFDLERKTLDQIAVTKTELLSFTQKKVLIDRANMRISQVRAGLEQSVLSDCPDMTFTQLYGRDVTSFLTDIALRANCLAGSGYVQAALVCPAPVCGNGIQETGEQCDDGNTISGDGCHSDCTVESGP